MFTRFVDVVGCLQEHRNTKGRTKMKKLTDKQKAALKPVMARERKAFKALMNDPTVAANPLGTHSPDIMTEWHEACAAERALRESFEA